MTQKEIHKTIAIAMFNFMQSGYKIKGINYNNGVLEVTCFPPENHEDVIEEKNLFIDLLCNYAGIKKR